MVTVDVDFAYNERLQGVLLSIRKHRGKILDFDPTGPGGGNPNILLQLPDKEHALAFLNERYPDDREEFNRSRIGDGVSHSCRAEEPAMYIMFGDEADKDAVEGKKFFVYGAIFVPTNSIASMHAEVEKLRTAAGLAATESLKSGTNTKPKGMTNENTILGKFNQFLNEQNSYGFAVMDRIPVDKPYDYLKEKFQVGMTQNGKPMGRYDRILGFAHGADGTSHLCSVCDILLGAFRYCANDPTNENAAIAMFPTLLKTMWRSKVDGKLTSREFGLCFRPLKIASPKFQAEYDALAERLTGYLNAKN